MAAEPVGGLEEGGRGDGDLGSAGAVGRGKKWSDLGDVHRGDPAGFADGLNGGWEPNKVTPCVFGLSTVSEGWSRLLRWEGLGVCSLNA